MSTGGPRRPKRHTSTWRRSATATSSSGTGRAPPRLSCVPRACAALKCLRPRMGVLHEASDARMMRLERGHQILEGRRWDGPNKATADAMFPSAPRGEVFLATGTAPQGGVGTFGPLYMWEDGRELTLEFTGIRKSSAADARKRCEESST